DHWLRGVPELVYRSEELGDIRCLFEIAAVLKPQAEMRYQAEVEPGAIDVNNVGAGLRLKDGLAALRNMEDGADPQQAKWPEVRHLQRRHPVECDLVGIGLHGGHADVAARNTAVVPLVGVIEGIGAFKTQDRI